MSDLDTLTPKLLTVDQAAKALGCSKNHVYRLIAQGVLGCVDIAEPGSKRTKTRIRPSDIDAFIASRSQ